MVLKSEKEMVLKGVTYAQFQRVVILLLKGNWSETMLKIIKW